MAAPDEPQAQEPIDLFVRPEAARRVNRGFLVSLLAGVALARGVDSPGQAVWRERGQRRRRRSAPVAPADEFGSPARLVRSVAGAEIRSSTAGAYSFPTLQTGAPLACGTDAPSRWRRLCVWRVRSRPRNPIPTKPPSRRASSGRRNPAASGSRQPRRLRRDRPSTL